MSGNSAASEQNAAGTSALSLTRENAVLKRYGAGAQLPEPELCCPVSYESEYLEILPDEIVAKDYGCGNPSAFVNEGERVLDLGSGSGKICYILSQKVGPAGRVTGVDFNDDMLSLARKYQDHMRQELGYGNVAFKKGKIQDLALDLDALDRWLTAHPVENVAALQRFEAECERLRVQEPMIPDASVDVVVSNCVLNLVMPEKKPDLFEEIHRVLDDGGRAVISDIVCDEDPPPSILNDSDLWSGCIAGAFREDRFLELFEEAGFHGVEILARQHEPWRVVEGIEFRSLTVRAFKGKEGPCMERNQAVVYRGPWKSVTDDDGHTLERGERMAVCGKTYRLLTDRNGPYSESIDGIEPVHPVSGEEARPWDSGRPAIRHPRESKGLDYDLTTEARDDCCGPSCC